jgi:hypothetical protein
MCRSGRVLCQEIALSLHMLVALTRQDASSSSSRGGSGSMSAPPVYTDFDSYRGGSVPTYMDVTPLDSSSLSRGDVVVVHVNALSRLSVRSALAARLMCKNFW